jgi:hypothetical protein
VSARTRLEALVFASGRVLRQSLRALFGLARGVAGVDAAFVRRPGRSLLALGRALAEAVGRAHQGTAQDMALLYLAGLGLLVVGRLFGS